MASNTPWVAGLVREAMAYRAAVRNYEQAKAANGANPNGKTWQARRDAWTAMGAAHRSMTKYVERLEDDAPGVPKGAA